MSGSKKESSERLNVFSNFARDDSPEINSTNDFVKK